MPSPRYEIDAPGYDPRITFLNDAAGHTFSYSYTWWEVVMPRSIDITGERFGRLVVIEKAGLNQRHMTLWRVRCDCSKETVVEGSNLRRGATRSCGCLLDDARRKSTGRPPSGKAVARTIEYRTWQHMIQRCENPTNQNYDRYGGRGITVCDRWRSSFTDFLADVGTRPSPGHSLDRINNEGNYEPGNVRWTTSHVQNRNKRPNRMLTFNGETMCLADWAARIGMSKDGLRYRLDHGWTVEKALTTPPDTGVYSKGNAA